MKLADARTMQEIDGASVREYGVKGVQLMENAGRAVAEVIKRELPEPRARVSIVAGKGNNGGDGFVAARHLKNSGANVSVFLLARIEDLKGDALDNALSWRKMGGEVFNILSPGDIKRHEPRLRHSSVIADAIFGTGLSSPVDGLHAGVIEFINSLKKKIIAVDIPSGINATTGAVMGCAVSADITATMALPKLGLYLYPGRSHAGRIEVIDIGAPRALLEDENIKWNLICGDDMRRVLRRRESDTHKGTYGHLLVIAGSPGMTGAAYMAGVAAMRAGSGLTTVCVPESLNAIMEAKTTEVMTIGLPETRDRTLGPELYERIKTIKKGKRAVLIGPGLGTTPAVSELIEKVAGDSEAPVVPVVIDADGLNPFAGRVAVLKEIKADKVLTPHPGEAGRLLGIDTEEVQKDRIGSAERLARESGATVVLKGASTVVAATTGEIFINPTGNPGMATAGTGDILSGMLGGLLAQGYSAIEAALVAVYLHGLAGDEVRKETGEAGMLATDLLPKIPLLLNSFIGPPKI